MSQDDFSPNLLPSTDKPKLVAQKVAQLFIDVQAEKNRLGLPEKWNRNYRLGKGAHWERKASAVGVPLATANLIDLHRRRTVNILTDNNPTFNVHRVGPEGDDDTFVTLERLAEYWWCEQKQQTVLEKSIINGETYGVAIEKVIFNPDQEYGLGEALTVVVDAYNFGIWPVDTREVQEAQAVLHVQALDIREARRRWPKLADQIKPDSTILSQLNDTRFEVISGQPAGFLTRFAGAVSMFINAAGRGNDSTNEKALIIECWAKDYTPGKDGAPLYTGHIRCVTVCNAGTLVLEDRDNPSINPEMPREEAIKTYLADKFPFATAASVTDPCTIWGQCDFDQLAHLQYEINKCLSQLTYHKDQSARPRIVNPMDTGVPNDAFSNRLGVINPTSAALSQAIRYMEFPNNTADIQQVLAIYKELFLQIAASSDLDRQDVRSGSQISGAALQILIEHASTMMRGKIRNYGTLITERGRMFLSHVQNWYTEERWFSFSDGQQTTPQAINGTAMRVPARLTVVNGSTMPVSKIQQREEAITLFQIGAVPRSYLLEKLDIPNAAQINQEMQAGPAGQAVQNLVAAGMLSPDAADQAAQVAGMDPKDVQKAVQSGQIHPLPPQGQDQQPQGPTPEEQAAALAAQKTQAEIAAIQASIQKVQAEIQAIMAKADVHRAEAGKISTDTSLAAQREQRESLQAVGAIKHDQEVHQLNVVKTIGEIKRQHDTQRHDQTMDQQKLALDQQQADMAGRQQEMERVAQSLSDKAAFRPTEPAATPEGDQGNAPV